MLLVIITQRAGAPPCGRQRTLQVLFALNMPEQGLVLLFLLSNKRIYGDTHEPLKLRSSRELGVVGKSAMASA